MKFVGGNYGFLWGQSKVQTIYIECMKHDAYSEISSLREFRPEEMSRLESVPLTVIIKREDKEVSLGDTNFQQLGHDWIRHDLGKFLQPPAPTSTVWLTFFGDVVNLEVEITEPAFDHLHQELHAFGSAADPKCFWGHTAGEFFLQHGTKLIEGSDKQRSAFLDKGLSVYSEGSMHILFAFGVDHPEEASWAF